MFIIEEICVEIWFVVSALSLWSFSEEIDRRIYEERNIGLCAQCESSGNQQVAGTEIRSDRAKFERRTCADGNREQPIYLRF